MTGGCVWQEGVHGGHAWQGACVTLGCTWKWVWQVDIHGKGGMHGSRGVRGRKNGNCSRRYALYCNASLLDLFTFNLIFTACFMGWRCLSHCMLGCTPPGPEADTSPRADTSHSGHPNGHTSPRADTQPGRHPLGTHTPPADTPGRHLSGRHTPPGQNNPLHSACWDTVNKRAVRIPLECILV